jgi:Predicted pPIWI-associating nuclease
MSGRLNKLTPVVDRERSDAVIKAVSKCDVRESNAWSDLNELSTHTQFEEIDAVPEGIFERGDRFSASATVYVTLQYGSNPEEEVSSSDEFPAAIDGHFEQENDSTKAVIDNISIDTSSFYK